MSTDAASLKTPVSIFLRSQTYFSLKLKFMELRDGSAIKSTGHSYRELGFDS